MSICARCGNEINSIVHCNGRELCYSCCKKCIHHDDEISVLKCSQRKFFNQLQNAGINITKEGVTMALSIVIMPVNKDAYILTAKSVETLTELIKARISKDIQLTDCHIHGDDFKVVSPRNRVKKPLNKKATSICDCEIFGTAAVVINGYGHIFGIKPKAAEIIAQKINEHNAEATQCLT